MSFLRFLIICAVITILGWGIYDLIVQKNDLAEEVGVLTERVQLLASENRLLSENIEYFKRPENLLKELKSRFNYREAEEKLIIIVPGATSTE